MAPAKGGKGKGKGTLSSSCFLPGETDEDSRGMEFGLNSW